jgi:tetratricopeptide (TPR) repeat protein
MSDGEGFEPVEDVRAAAQEAAAAGIAVVTVGFGTPAGTTIPVREGTAVVTKRDTDGNVVVTRYMPELLQAAAQAAQGSFIPAEATDKAARIRTALSGLKAQRRALDAGQDLTPRFAWFLAPALLLLLLDSWRTGRPRRAAPDAATEPAVRGNAARAAGRAAAALVAAASLYGCAPGAGADVSLSTLRWPRVPAWPFGSGRAAADSANDEALAAYVRGEPAVAHALYRGRARGGAPLARYNLGTSLVALDSLEAARPPLDEALRAPAPEVRWRAQFNLGLVALRRGLAAPGDSGRAELDAALALYKRALLARPGDADAKWNYELALRRRQGGGGGGGGGRWRRPAAAGAARAAPAAGRRARGAAGRGAAERRRARGARGRGEAAAAAPAAAAHGREGLVTLLAALALALLRVLAQVTVVVSAPAEVAWQDRVLVSVEVRAPAGRDVELAPPSFAPLRLVSATRVADANTLGAPAGALRAAWQVIEWRYVLAAPDTAAGRYVFFPFVARVTGRGARAVEARSNPWSLTVRPPPPGALAARPAGPSPDAPAPDGRDGITVHARLAPEVVYVGQQATYALSVSVDERTRERLRRNPEFVPPDLRGVLAYDLAAGQGTTSERTANGRRYDVHVFQRALFPLQPGTIDVPAATLTYALPLGVGFFSREESHVRRSEALRLVVREPPGAGRPGDWSGAVGRLRVAARVDTAVARVGDAVVYTLRVEGEGNVPLLPRPALRVPWAAVLPSGERVTVDSTSTRVRGAKEFDWLLTPRQAGEQSVPPARYPYFDPDAERYETALADAVTVRVLPGALAAATPSAGAAGAAAPAALALRTTWTGDAPVALTRRPILWGLALAAPVPALVVLAVRGRRRRGRASPTSPERALAALSAEGEPDPRAVRRRFLDALGGRLAIPSEALGSSAARVQLLRRCGVSGDAARAVDALVSRLDGAAFGRAAPGSARALAGEAAALVARVDAEACGDALAAVRAPRARPAGAARAAWGAAAALLALAAGAVAAGRGPAAAGDGDTVQRIVSRRDPRPTFTRGLDAAGRGEWGIAARAFRDAAAAAPRSPDAWTNAGTAAWVAGDTVQAAAAWHRAIRLAPRADDVRARRALLRSDAAPSRACRASGRLGAAAALGAWWLPAGPRRLAARASRRVGRAVAWRAAAAALAPRARRGSRARRRCRARRVASGPAARRAGARRRSRRQDTLADLARVDARRPPGRASRSTAPVRGWVESCASFRS